MKPQEKSLAPVGATRLVRCSSFMDVEQRFEVMRKEVDRLWALVGVLAVACLMLAVDAWIQGDLIQRSSNQPYREAVQQSSQRKSPPLSKTQSSSTPSGPISSPIHPTPPIAQ